MQISIVDNDVIAPTYTCGKHGESIDVLQHGVTYSVWKIQDNLEKHLKTCKPCNLDKIKFDKLIASLFEDLSESAGRTKDAIGGFLRAFNK